MREMWRKVQHVTSRADTLDAVDDVQHATPLDHGDLLVFVSVYGRDDTRLDREPTDHQLLADNHLPVDAFGDPFGRDGIPVHVESRGLHAPRRSRLISSLCPAPNRLPQTRAAR